MNNLTIGQFLRRGIDHTRYLANIKTVFHYLLIAISSITLFFTLLLNQNLALAQAPINFDSAETQFFEGSAVRSFGKYIHIADDSLDRDLTILEIPLLVSYAVRKDVAIFLRFPYINKSFKERGNAVRSTVHNDGFGDMAIMGKWSFLKWLGLWKRTEFAGIVGLELPTGDTNRKDSGKRLDPFLQLGSGSFDPFFRLAFEKIVRRLSFFSELSYKINTQGAQGFEFGDVLDYNLAVAYRFYPAKKYPNPELFGLMELNGVFEQESERKGRNVSNTGGHTLFLSPGVQFIARLNLLFELSVQIPIYQDLKGKQLERDLGDPGDFNYLFGFRFFY